jgi:hypothetical protein
MSMSIDVAYMRRTSDEKLVGKCRVSRAELTELLDAYEELEQKKVIFTEIAKGNYEFSRINSALEFQNAKLRQALESERAETRLLLDTQDSHIEKLRHAVKDLETLCVRLKRTVEHSAHRQDLLNHARRIAASVGIDPPSVLRTEKVGEPG